MTASQHTKCRAESSVADKSVIRTIWLIESGGGGCRRGIRMRIIFRGGGGGGGVYNRFIYIRAFGI